MLLPKTQPNPFPFLLYTEWVMLSSCSSLAIFEAWQEKAIPVQHILILALLAFMGLNLPKSDRFWKYIYTSLEIALIFFGTVLGYLHILPTLYVIVMIRSCFIFDQPGRWIVAGISFILFSLHQIQYLNNLIPLMLPNIDFQQIWMHLLAEFLMFGLVLFLVSQLVSTLLNERKTKLQLVQAHEKLRDYALQIEDLAAVQERNRIAREIHDSLGHALTNLNIQLQTAGKLWQHDREEAHTFLEQAQKLGKLAMQEVRQSVHSLRVDAESQTSLESGIIELMEDFRASTGVSISHQMELGKTLPPQMLKTIYRIVQESLTNICKYANASHVKLSLQAREEKIYLTIEDDGIGFDTGRRNSGFGLRGMKERVAALSGEFQLETAPDQGCRIIVIIPLEGELTKPLNRGILD